MRYTSPLPGIRIATPQGLLEIFFIRKKRCLDTAGWLPNPAPVGRWLIPS